MKYEGGEGGEGEKRGWYEGMWSNGMMHGRGKQVKASGDIYEGDFQFGLRFVYIYI